MNWKMIWRIIAYILGIEAVLMTPSLFISIGYHEPRAVYGYSLAIPITLAAAGLLYFITRGANKKGFYQREGFVTTSLSWLMMSVFGCLPFVLSGEIPRFIDALFEMVSGFTTTGSSILTNVEALDKGLLFWRSFSHWIGGMGVLVFLMAIVPLGGKNQGFTLHILRAESPGPSVGKMAPRMRQTAGILYKIYIALTILDMIFLLLGKMDLFSSMCLAFGTAGTGGFGVLNTSFASYSPYIQWVTIIFMLLFGVNFSIYYMIVLRHFKEAKDDEELHWYLGIVLISTVLLVLSVKNMYPTLSEAIRDSAFAVSTIISTTGYGTADFNTWSPFAKAIILFLMMSGASAGSTGGGIKVIRLMLLTKVFRRNVHENIHPDEVSTVRINHRKVNETVLKNVQAYLIVYVAIIIMSVIIISLDGFSFETNFSAVMATLNNIGPGLDAVGPTSNYYAYSNLSKVVLIFCMLAGRLEIYPVILLFSRRSWRNRR